MGFSKVPQRPLIEDAFICIRLSEDRIALYQEKFSNNKKMPIYIENKYKNFNYATLKDYCNKKSLLEGKGC